MATEIEMRRGALAAHLDERATLRDDSEASFLAGWDAAIDSIERMTPAQVRDFRKPGITIVHAPADREGDQP